MGLHNSPSFLGLVLQSKEKTQYDYQNIFDAFSFGSLSSLTPGQMIFINIKGSYIHIPFIFQIKVYNKKVAPHA